MKITRSKIRLNRVSSTVIVETNETKLTMDSAQFDSRRRRDNA